MEGEREEGREKRGEEGKEGGREGGRKGKREGGRARKKPNLPLRYRPPGASACCWGQQEGPWLPVEVELQAEWPQGGCHLTGPGRQGMWAGDRLVL